ncbi:MAG TPA: alpha/beta fold hydrolase [Caldilineaceae bacterium]|nr:alpha/beta fold hydrolase [Caldilineaceae bacterium]
MHRQRSVQRKARNREFTGYRSVRHAPEPFCPHRLVRHGPMQTMLALYRPRRVRAVVRGEAPVIIDAGADVTGLDDGVRLLGYYNRRRHDGPSRGLVINLHGWEGSSHAVYCLVLADYLLEAGYDVFRLNLRDHGPQLHLSPHALNRGLFLGTLLDESHTAVQRVAELAGDKPVYLTGPSMGGNFVLRMARLHRERPIRNLRKVVAVSPAINPGRSTDLVDAQYIYRRYFRPRWLRSLLRKQQLFPELYDFSDLVTVERVREMTERLVRRYTEFESADEYFAAYSVLGDALAGLTVPVTIITAADDAVIPVADFYALAPSPCLEIQIHPAGGHVGFLDLSPLRHCLPAMVEAAFLAG